MQVADRWHLLHNLTEALQRTVDQQADPRLKSPRIASGYIPRRKFPPAETWQSRNLTLVFSLVC